MKRTALSNSQTIRIALVIFTAAALTGCSLIGVRNSQAATVDTRPTLAQLTTELSTSAAATTLPTNAKQMLAAVASKYPGYYVGIRQSSVSGCSASTSQSSLPAKPLSACFYGDPKGKKSLVLIGDSQSDMWMPALNTIGVSLGLRIYAFGKAGCPPWDYVTTNPDGSAFPECVTWRASVRQFINTNHPNYVLATGAAGFTSAFHHPSAVEMAAGINGLANSIKPSNARLILLSNIPWIGTSNSAGPPNSCLAANTTAISKCFAARTSDALVNSTGLGLTQAATQYKIPLVDISSLFCTPTTCVSVVGTQLVFAEQYHALASYITYISRALVPLLAPKLL